MSRLIDVDAAIPMIKYATTDNEIGVFPIKIGYDDIVKVLNAQPTVDAEPVKHAYLRKSRVFGKLDECSNCGCAYPHNRGKGVYLNYCAKCGAKIDGEVWD